MWYRWHSRRQADSHKESRKGLRKVFEERRIETPARPERLRVRSQVVEGQAVNLPKIDDQRFASILGFRRRGQEVQTLPSPFADFFPSPLTCEFRIRVLVFHDRANRSQCDLAGLHVRQIAGLADDDQIPTADGDLLVRRRSPETLGDVGHQARCDEIALRQGAAGDSLPKGDPRV